MDPTPGRFEMEKFDGSGDFGLWKFKLLGQLEIQGLLPVLSEDWTTVGTREVLKADDPKLAVKETFTDQKKADKDLRTRNLIATCISDRILRKVMKETTALGMWKALEKEYQTKSLPNRIYLKQRFASFRMEENKSIEDNVDNFLKLVADLASLKVDISEEDQAIQLLSSLPPQFEPLVHTLKYGTGKETITVSEVTSAAYDKELELKQKGKYGSTSKSGDSLYVGSRGRSNNRYDKGKGNGYKGRSKSRGRSKSKPRFDAANKGACFICGKEGHWKRECPEKGQRKPGDAANVVLEVPQPMVLTVSTDTSNGEWILDSGCTFHMTPDKSQLFDLEEFEGTKVRMANKSISQIRGIGKIKVVNPDNTVVILSEVRYIPDFDKSLISVGMLDKNGCKYEGGDGMQHYYKEGKKVFSAKWYNGLYYLQATVVNAEANAVAENANMTDIWHSRLGHMSSKNMEILSKQGYVSDIKIKELSFCDDCVLGKSHQQPFPTAKHTTKGILEYVHSDL